MAETDAQATTTKNFYKSKASFSQSLSLNQMANLDDKKFSMKAYKVPKGEYSRLPIKNCASIQDKLTKRTFFDDNTDRTKQVPGHKYQSQWKWAQHEGGFRPKGKFMQSAKLTMTAERMKEAKKIPGCNKYNMDSWKKITVNTKT